MPSLRALARQSIAARLRKLDCFVAFAPRNDDQTHLLLSAPRSLFLIPPPSWGGVAHRECNERCVGWGCFHLPEKDPHPALRATLPTLRGGGIRTHLRDLAARFARGLQNVEPSEIQRAQGMPGARRAAASHAKNRSIRVSSPRSHRHHPAFPAQWFTTYIVLSPVIGLGCHRRRRDTSRPLHASVEASGPHDFAVRIRCCSSAAHPRPSHPAPRSVTLRNAPRFGAGRQHCEI